MAPKPYTLLAAIDLELGSQFVLQAALRTALAHAPTDLHVVAVASPTFAVGNDLAAAPYAALSYVDTQALAQRVKETADAFFATVGGAPDVHVIGHAMLGAPADEIVWLAAHLDADRVIVGTHNRRGLKRLLLGSVAEKVARLAGCEVMVVRDKHHNEAWRVPEVEPLCPDCAERRAKTKGAALWCERHSEHHARAHLVTSGSRGPRGPEAWSSMTGT